jgi:ribosomal protein L7Ae-like RNA K-turn-binding protein
VSAVAPPEVDPAAAWRRKVLGLIGLGVRGRLAVTGAEQVREQARRGQVVLAIVAQDVSRHTLDKVVPLLRAKRVEILEWPSAAELGAVVGREATAAVGIVDRALARGIREASGSVSPRDAVRSGAYARDAQRRKG